MQKYPQVRVKKKESKKKILFNNAKKFLGVMRRCDYKEPYKIILGVTELLCNLAVLMVTQIYAYVKTHNLKPQT